MSVTTGNGGAPDKKWLNFRIVMSDVNLNPSINRIAKNLFIGTDDEFNAITRPEKLEMINQYIIGQLKLLSRINHIDHDIELAKAKIADDFDKQIDIAEEP